VGERGNCSPKGINVYVERGQKQQHSQEGQRETGKEKRRHYRPMDQRLQSQRHYSRLDSPNVQEKEEAKKGVHAQMARHP